MAEFNSSTGITLKTNADSHAEQRVEYGAIVSGNAVPYVKTIDANTGEELDSYPLISESYWRYDGTKLISSSNIEIDGNLYQYVEKPVHDMRSTLLSNKAGIDPVTELTSLGSRYVHDKDGDLSYYSEVMKQSNDRIYVSHAVRRRKSDGTGVTNALYLGVAADGTRDVSFTDAAIWRSALGLKRLTLGPAIFSGKNVAKGGSIGTNTAVFEAGLFYIGLSSGFCIGYRSGNTSTAGTIRGIGGADNGSKTYIYACQIAVSTAGALTYTSGSSHVLSLSNMEATALNFVSLYPLSVY